MCYGPSLNSAKQHRRSLALFIYLIPYGFQALPSVMPGLHMSAYAPPGSMAWTVPQYPAAMSTQSMLNPGLKFFIERDNGSLVPLVPADELPDDVRLIGVPLSLSALQAKNMLFLGHDSSARRKYSHAGSMSIKESVAPIPVAMKYTPEVVPDNNHIPQVGLSSFDCFLPTDVISTALSGAASSHTYHCIHTDPQATHSVQPETSLQRTSSSTFWH